jgi:Family of unknown function (DUF6776)
MVHVPPPPLLVVRSHDPARRWRVLLLTGLGWLVSVALAAGAIVVLRDRVAAAGDHSVLDRLARTNEDLQRRIAVLERSEQVARAANADLQQVLRDRQEQIFGLRADLAFYSRLTGTGALREGLAVQSVRLTPAAEPRVYNFTLTITQNLRAGRVTAGRARVSVTGVRDGKLVTLGWPELAANQDHDGMQFSFKYFQQLKGAVMLPDGFTPNRIHAEADGGGDMGHAEQDFAWSDALSAPEVTDVQQ